MQSIPLNPANPAAFLQWNGLTLSAPQFSIQGRCFGTALEGGCAVACRTLAQGAEEQVYAFTQKDFPGLTLELVLRTFPNSPILRMKYRFQDPGKAYVFTREAQPLYLAVPYAQNAQWTEIQLAQFDAMVHSYTPYLRTISPQEQAADTAFIGPMALWEEKETASLLAYEHGADAPDRYLEFAMKDTSMIIRGVKGNTFPGQMTDGYSTCWFQVGRLQGRQEDLLRAYRRFQLAEVCENTESRKPYVFYNTWNYQERVNNYGGKAYLSEMTEYRVLGEIEVAHTLGIDVFVIDVGWFGKTGDWQVSTARFPHGLEPIRHRLEGYGMKLGLWFNPTVAARTSRVYQEHPEWAMSWNGETHFGPIWETEESCGMCLASDYAEEFIHMMVNICKNWGVSYLKWDGISQYGCNSPLHHHGTDANTPQEREEAYAYQMGLAMIHIVEEITRQCPGVIVDFDITEGGRFVGLGFLSVGKYFLVNNGPYAMDFDMPENATALSNKLAVGLWGWSNLFFFPGAARPRFCRSGALYDSIIPSILYLTHYLPDGDTTAQDNSLASLALGGNGIWGDLAALTEEERTYLAQGIARYKAMAQSITQSYPRVVGHRGISPEIHEKLDASGEGAVIFFAAKPGSYQHITRPLPGTAYTAEGAACITRLPSGALQVEVNLPKNGACTVFIHKA